MGAESGGRRALERERREGEFLIFIFFFKRRQGLRAINPWVSSTSCLHRTVLLSFLSCLPRLCYPDSNSITITAFPLRHYFPFSSLFPPLLLCRSILLTLSFPLISSTRSNAPLPPIIPITPYPLPHVPPPDIIRCGGGGSPYPGAARRPLVASVALHGCTP